MHTSRLRLLSAACFQTCGAERAAFPASVSGHNSVSRPANSIIFIITHSAEFDTARSSTRSTRPEDKVHLTQIRSKNLDIMRCHRKLFSLFPHIKHIGPI